MSLEPVLRFQTSALRKGVSHRELTSTFEVYAKACLLGHKNEKYLYKALQGVFNEAGSEPLSEFGLFLKCLCEKVDPVVEVPSDSPWKKVFKGLDSTVRLQAEYRGQDSPLFTAFALMCFASRESSVLLPFFERAFMGKERSFSLKFINGGQVLQAERINVYTLFFLTQTEQFSEPGEGLLQALTPFAINCSPDPVKPLDVVLQDKWENPFNWEMYLCLRELCFEQFKERWNQTKSREVIEHLLLETRTVKSLLPSQKEWLEGIYNQCPEDLQEDIKRCLHLDISFELALPYKDYLRILEKHLPTPSMPIAQLTPNLTDKLTRLFRLSLVNDQVAYNDALVRLLMEAARETDYADFLFMLVGKPDPIVNVVKAPFLKALLPEAEGEFALEVHLEKEGSHHSHELLTYFVYEYFVRGNVDSLMQAFFDHTHEATFFCLTLKSVRNPSHVIIVAHLNQASFYWLFQRPNMAWLSEESGLLRFIAALFPIEAISKGVHKWICPLTESEAAHPDKTLKDCLDSQTPVPQALKAFLRTLSPENTPRRSALEQVLQSHQAETSKSKLPLTIYETLLSQLVSVR